QSCRVLLDSGSQSNFIAKKFVEKLGIRGEPFHIPVVGINQCNTQIKTMLPFKGDPNSLGDTYSVALKRFHNLEKRLNKDVDLKMQNADCNEIAYQIPKGLIIPEERRGILGLPNINETPNNLFTRYSSLSKLVRVTAYCLRFSKNIISRIKGSTKENRSGNLTLDEVNEARRCLIKLVQRETYASELSQLKLSGTGSSTLFDQTCTKGNVC
ncbi:hypothetical protein QE152_g41309, partial [Popillia japonica]